MTTNFLELKETGYSISTEPTKLDVEMIYQYLSTEAYWSKGIPLEKVISSIENSFNFGVYWHEQQVGYARIVTDFTSIAYLGDVFILENHRGKGLSKWLLHTIMGHSRLQGLRRWILLTNDAHELYRPFGWSAIQDPNLWMELHRQ